MHFVMVLVMMLVVEAPAAEVAVTNVAVVVSAMENRTSEARVLRVEFVRLQRNITLNMGQEVQLHRGLLNQGLVLATHRGQRICIRQHCYCSVRMNCIVFYGDCEGSKDFQFNI